MASASLGFILGPVSLLALAFLDAHSTAPSVLTSSGHTRHTPTLGAALAQQSTEPVPESLQFSSVKEGLFSLWELGDQG